MSITLPGSLRAAVDTCVFCPKLCRWACPVAEAESRETVTPWGLMTSIDDISRGAPLDAESAEVWAHCTGCGRCQQACKHDNDVFGVLRHARMEAVDAGTAPDGWRVWSDEKPPAAPSLDALPDGGSIRILGGYADEARVAASLAVLRAAGFAELGRPGRIRTSGHRALSAGRPVAFAVATDDLRAAIEGVGTLICLDAEDAETLRYTYEERGLWTHGAPRVMHLVEAVEGRLPPLEPSMSGDVLYLDACRLGRGLGVTDAPRVILEAAIGGAIREALTIGEDGGCCGAGAGLTVLSPETAKAVAGEAVALEPDVPVVIAGACVDHLRAALAPRAVHGWADVIARALPSEGESA